MAEIDLGVLDTSETITGASEAFLGPQEGIPDGRPFADAQQGDLVAFEQWLGQGNGGRAFHYATAIWLDERQRHRSGIYVLPEATRDLGRAAWRAYQAGKVLLVQRRDHDGFAYLAVKRRHRCCTGA